MTDPEDPPGSADRRVRRRTVLRAGGTLAAAVLAGCSGSGSGESTTPGGSPRRGTTARGPTTGAPGTPPATRPPDGTPEGTTTTADPAETPSDPGVSVAVEGELAFVPAVDDRNRDHESVLRVRATHPGGLVRLSLSFVGRAATPAPVATVTLDGRRDVRREVRVPSRLVPPDDYGLVALAVALRDADGGVTTRRRYLRVPDAAYRIDWTDRAGYATARSWDDATPSSGEELARRYWNDAWNYRAELSRVEPHVRKRLAALDGDDHWVPALVDGVVDGVRAELEVPHTVAIVGGVRRFARRLSDLTDGRLDDRGRAAVLTWPVEVRGPGSAAVVSREALLVDRRADRTWVYRTDVDPYRYRTGPDPVRPLAATDYADPEATRSALGLDYAKLRRIVTGDVGLGPEEPRAVHEAVVESLYRLVDAARNDDPRRPPDAVVSSRYGRDLAAGVRQLDAAAVDALLSDANRLVTAARRLGEFDWLVLDGAFGRVETYAAVPEEAARPIREFGSASVASALGLDGDGIVGG